MAAQTGTIWSATPTPFLDNGSLDEAALVRVIEQHLNLGVTGLFLAGSCGEGPFMPDVQRGELVRFMKRKAGDKLTLAVQVSDTSAARVRENICQAKDAGADYAVIAPPWLERFANTDFMRRYFLEAIEHSEIPVGIYVLKAKDDSPLNLDLWREIAQHPKVTLIKDSSGTEKYRDAFAAIRKDRPKTLLLTGNEFDVLSSVSAGYDGALLGTGILIGGLIRKAVEALTAGDNATAEKLQKQSNEFLYGIFGRDISLWLGGLKYTLKKLGIFNTEYMHLSFPLTDANRADIDRAIASERKNIFPQPVEK